MVEKSSTAIAEYSATEAGLAELRSRLSGVVYQDIQTTKGMDVAKKDRAMLRGMRTDLEEMRKELKGPVLDRAKLIDTEAKRLTGAITELEEPIAAQIKVEEDRREAEKERKAAEERVRLNAIHASIDAIRRLPQEAVGKSSAEIAAIRNSVAEMRSIEGWERAFQEFGNEAKAVRDSAIIQLADLQDRALKQEQEAARLTEERAELEALRALEAKRKADESIAQAEAALIAAVAEKARKEAERIEAARVAAAEKAERDAERMRVAAAQEVMRQREEALKAEEARIEKMRRDAEAESAARRDAALEAEQKVARAAEAARIAETKAADDRRLAAEAAVAAADKAALQAEMASMMRAGAAMDAVVTKKLKRALPTHVEIIEHLADHYEVSPATVLDWIGEMDVFDLLDHFSEKRAA